MRKRLFLFAAAICFALFAFATPAFAEDPVVAKIGNDEYTTLQDAITAACNDLTSNDVTITLQSDLELTEGLQFIGSGDTAAQWKNITIDAADPADPAKNTSSR